MPDGGPDGGASGGTSDGTADGGTAGTAAMTALHFLTHNGTWLGMISQGATATMEVWVRTTACKRLSLSLSLAAGLGFAFSNRWRCVVVAHVRQAQPELVSSVVLRPGQRCAAPSDG